jgi:hypothetical protein
MRKSSDARQSNDLSKEVRHIAAKCIKETDIGLPIIV